MKPNLKYTRNERNLLHRQIAMTEANLQAKKYIVSKFQLSDSFGNNQIERNQTLMSS